MLLNVGSPTEAILEARGIASGDRLCVFDKQSAYPGQGCLNNITPLSNSLSLQEVPGWQPQIMVRPINSVTLMVTVTQVVTEGTLWLQIFPAAPITSAFDITAPVKIMQPIFPSVDIFTQTFTFPYLLFNGYARLWLSNTTGITSPEAISYFSSTPSWDGNKSYSWGGNKAYGWRGNAYGWGSNQIYGWAANRQSWVAPIASPNGQVKIFNMDAILDGHDSYAFTTLQALMVPPSLPAWLTRVGNVYHYKAVPHNNNLVIQFQYLQREVPLVQESQLNIYYSADNGQTWQPLEGTTVDITHNLVSASMPGPGLYALAATIETPALNTGWNLFAYPNVNPRTVDIALASIAGDYSVIYHREEAWQLYAPDVWPTFAPLVNTLDYMTSLQTYWIYALTNTVPYIKPLEETRSLLRGVQIPPTTFYGWVTPTNGVFTPTLGMQITAEINGTTCGQTTIEALDGKLAYSLQVMSESIVGDGFEQCGANGRLINFRVEDQLVGQSCRWDNSHAWYYPLTTTPIVNHGHNQHPCRNYQIWLPLIYTE